MIPTKLLHQEVEIPQLGFGVFQVPPEETKLTVETAISTGYRHIDTATVYRNERGVGEAVAASEVARDDLFITTKVWNDSQGHDPALAAFGASLERLGMDRVDLYLIHWPRPASGLQVETWAALQKIHDEGRSRAIGVSNYRIEDLELLADAGGTQPSINQIELHPYLQQKELRKWHEDNGIVTEAWSPLAKGEVLADPVITRIAETVDRTPGQVVLRWHLQLGNVVIPKSVTPSRIQENFELFDFELSDEHMTEIEAMDHGHRTGPDPGTFESS